MDNISKINTLTKDPDINGYFKLSENGFINLSQDELRIILDTIPAHVFFKDANDRHIFVNKALAEAVGIAQDKLTGITTMELLGKNAFDYMADDKEVLTTGKAKRNIIEAISTSKGLRWVQTDKLPYKDADGNTIGIVGISFDITERKKAEIALENSEKRFREILENIQMVAIILDVHGKVTFCNDFLLELTNWKREEILGQCWFNKFLDKSKGEKLLSLYCDKIADGEIPHHYEGSIFTKEGEERIITWNTTLITDEQGNVVGSTSIGKDITERKQYEEKLKKLNADKDKFFSIIAHDLKSPFTALLGFSEYLAHYLEELSPDEIRDFAINIHKSANGVFRLIENLLQWSRFQSGRIEFAPLNFDFSDLADILFQLYQASAFKKKLHLEFDLQPDLTAYADKNMIETVLRNLISNAIKFTNTGGKIKLTAHKEDNFIEVNVIDNGVGISAENATKLFKLSEKFSTKGTDHEKGTGLGLMLCKEFVEKNGGSIMVFSRPGEGSRFMFTVPAGKQI
ncbi:MAG: PAS domain S-box protein [Bacillota bacterium]